MKNVAERIKYFRNLLRLPQSFVADQLEIGRPSYTKMERNVTEFSASQLQILANLFRVKIEEFFQPMRIEPFQPSSLRNAQFRLTKSDFRIADSEAPEAINQSVTDLLTWARDKKNETELKRRQKKAEETYAKFNNLNDAIQYCQTIVEKYTTAGDSVDVIHMAMEEFGLWMSWNSFGVFSGVYLKKGTEIANGTILPLPVVGIHSGHPSERQRFSGAHELGHHLLGQRGKLGSPTKPVTDLDEKEANQFASELLMNRDRVIKIMKEFTDTYQSKFELPSIVLLAANHLQVSYTALVRKLIHLGAVPFEHRDQLLQAKVRELQQNLAKGPKSLPFQKKQFEKSEKSLQELQFYKTDEQGAPRHPQDIRFLQDYCYVDYLNTCKANPPLNSSIIFQKVVQEIADRYPMYSPN